MTSMPHNLARSTTSARKLTSAALPVLLMGMFAWTVAPASAGGLLGGVGSVAASATSNVGGAVGLGGGTPIGGLGGALSGGSGSGMLGATLTGNGLRSGVASEVARPLSNVAGTRGLGAGGSGRAWGTFEDAKSALKDKPALAKDRTLALTSRGQKTTKGLLDGGVSKSQSVAEGTKGKATTSLADGVVLSRTFRLPDTTAQGAVQAHGEATAGGAASNRRAKVAGNANGSGQIKAGQ